jgi:hypothetical protein
MTATPASRSDRAVPPVEKISTPALASFLHKSTTPCLSETDTKARLIPGIVLSWKETF